MINDTDDFDILAMLEEPFKKEIKAKDITVDMSLVAKQKLALELERNGTKSHHEEMNGNGSNTNNFKERGRSRSKERLSENPKTNEKDPSMKHDRSRKSSRESSNKEREGRSRSREQTERERRHYSPDRDRYRHRNGYRRYDDSRYDDRRDRRYDDRRYDDRRYDDRGNKYSRSPEGRNSRKGPSPRRRTPSPIGLVDPAERDRRTVFCQQLAARLTNAELKNFLAVCGRIRECKLVQDKISRRSKGIAYVEFYAEESVPKAIGLTGQKLLGLPIIVSASEAEKNAEAEAKVAAAAVVAAGMVTAEEKVSKPEIVTDKIFLGNLATSVTEEDVRQLCEEFGRLRSVKLHYDSQTGKSKGFALVVFRNTQDARAAIKSLHSKRIEGKEIEVRGVEGNDSLDKYRDLDDSDVKGVSLNSLSRVELMAKLARDDVRVAGNPTPTSNSIIETPYVVLKNMFDPDEDLKQDWEKEIEQDVYEECSKFGGVLHIAVDPKTRGFIYLKFESLGVAKAAVESLHGRYFAGKVISANYIEEPIYYAKYPSAARK